MIPDHSDRPRVLVEVVLDVFVITLDYSLPNFTRVASLSIDSVGTAWIGSRVRARGVADRTRNPVHFGRKI